MSRALRSYDWQPEELAILDKFYPEYGTRGVAKCLMTMLNVFRTELSIRDQANRRRLQRLPWKLWEREVFAQLWTQGFGPVEMCKMLEPVRWYRSANEIKEHALELGVGPPPKRTVEQSANLYRTLTASTIDLIRTWAAEGDSAEDLARLMTRPVWFVKAVIEGKSWSARWERETGRREWVAIIGEQGRVAECA